jgi:hypothetical protein
MALATVLSLEILVIFVLTAFSKEWRMEIISDHDTFSPSVVLKNVL